MAALAAETGKPVTTVAIITRRLKENKTYEDFRKAWFHTTGFGVPGKEGQGGSNTMYSLVNIFDPREIIVLGFATTTLEQLHDALNIEVEFRGQNPLDDVIEPEIGRTFAALVSVDDFSASGTIPYTPPSIDGRETDPAEFARTLQAVAGLFAAAAKERDAINEARRKG